MKDQYPLPGDTIEVTWDHPAWKGKRFVVVECPEYQKGGSNDHPSHAWFVDANIGEPSYLASFGYKVVERRNRTETSTVSDVDEPLNNNETEC